MLQGPVQAHACCNAGGVDYAPCQVDSHLHTGALDLQNLRCKGRCIGTGAQQIGAGAQQACKLGAAWVAH